MKLDRSLEEVNLNGRLPEDEISAAGMIMSEEVPDFYARQRAVEKLSQRTIPSQLRSQTASLPERTSSLEEDLTRLGRQIYIESRTRLEPSLKELKGEVNEKALYQKYRKVIKEYDSQESPGRVGHLVRNILKADYTEGQEIIRNSSDIFSQEYDSETFKAMLENIAENRAYMQEIEADNYRVDEATPVTAWTGKLAESNLPDIDGHDLGILPNLDMTLKAEPDIVTAGERPAHEIVHFSESMGPGNPVRADHAFEALTTYIASEGRYSVKLRYPRHGESITLGEGGCLDEEIEALDVSYGESVQTAKSMLEETGRKLSSLREEMDEIERLARGGLERLDASEHALIDEVDRERERVKFSVDGLERSVNPTNEEAMELAEREFSTVKAIQSELEGSAN